MSRMPEESQPFFHVLHFEQLDSTNAWLRKMAAGGVPEGTVIWADRQTAGRGRHGRAWYSTGNWGLWFSMVLRPTFPSQNAGWLSIAAGVGVASSLHRLSGLGPESAVRPELKWPNDVLLGGRKVCGILCETSISGSALDWAVVGIGLNRLVPPEGFPEDIRLTAAALEEFVLESDMPSAQELVSSILAGVYGAYRRLSDGGADALRLQAEALMGSMLGKEVSCATPAGTLSGIAMGLDSHGALVLRDARGVEFSVNAGDVSLGTGRFIQEEL